MSRLTILCSVAAAIVVTVAGAYYVVQQRTEVVVHGPGEVSTPQPAPPADTPKQRPNHGDFNRRFEPSVPGKSN